MKKPIDESPDPFLVMGAVVMFAGAFGIGISVMLMWIMLAVELMFPAAVRP